MRNVVRVCETEKKCMTEGERTEKERACWSIKRTSLDRESVYLHGCVCHGCAVSTRGPPNSPLVGGSHTDADILTTDPPAGEKPLTGTLLIYSLQSPIFTSLQLANTLDVLFIVFP